MDFMKAKQLIQDFMEEESNDKIKIVYLKEQASMKKVITAQDP